MSFGANIRSYRRKRGMEVTDLADAMRTRGYAWTVRTVNDTEHGRRAVPAREMTALADILGADPLALFPERV